MRWPFYLAASALLLFAGCDYWDNLFNQKVLDRKDLNLAVVDAFTREGIAASCTTEDLGNGEADLNGRLSFTDVPLGKYPVRCSAPHYFPGERNAVLTAGTDHADTVWMARMGGSEHWYPRDPRREVDLKLDQISGSQAFPIGGNPVKAPVDLGIEAIPADTSLFTYEWSSTWNRQLVIRMRGKATEILRTDTLPFLRDTLVDTLSVTIRTRENGVLSNAAGDPNPYLVGSYTRLVKFIRNRKPTLEIIGTPSLTRPFNCKDEEVSLIVAYRAKDPDGTCTVEMTNTDPASSLRSLPIKGKPCDGEVHREYITLLQPSKSDQDGNYANVLKILARDDNRDSAVDAISFVTHVSQPPVGTISKLEDRSVFLSPMTLTFRIDAISKSSPLKSLRVDWGDSSTYFKPFSTIPGLTVDSFLIVQPKEYALFTETPGKRLEFRPRLIVENICGNKDTVFHEALAIQRNRKPNIELAEERFIDLTVADSNVYRFVLKVTDPDLGGDLGDSIKLIHVEWGDTTENWSTKPGADRPMPTHSQLSSGLEVRHAYKWKNANAFTLLIQAFDTHDGWDDETRIIRRPSPGTIQSPALPGLSAGASGIRVQPASPAPPPSRAPKP